MHLKNAMFTLSAGMAMGLAIFAICEVFGCLIHFGKFW